MADEDVTKAEASSGGGKKKLILLVLLALLLIAGSIGGTIFALKILSPEPELAPVETEVAEDVKKPAIYYPIKPAIIANFGYKGRQRYAQIDISLLIRDPSIIPAIELHAPLLTNALVMTISGQVYSDLQTAEGKELLRQQCLQELQKILEKEIGQPGIEQVLFTNFVMQ